MNVSQKIASGVAALALCAAAPAFAAPYGKVEAGVSAGTADTNGTQTLIVPGEANTITSLSDEADLDAGWQASVAYGWEDVFVPGFRLEVEGLYTSNDIDGTDATSVNTYGGFVNAYFDFPTETAFKPYIGVGVGYGETQVDIRDSEADEAGMMYQAKAGVGYELSETTTLDVGYRYLNATDAEFDFDSADDDLTTDDDLLLNGEVDTEIHAITVGMRWKFGT